MARERELPPALRPIREMTRRKWWITAGVAILTFINQDEFALGVGITGRLIFTEFNVSLAISLGDPTLTNEALPEHFRDESLPLRDVWVSSRGASDVFKGGLRYGVAAGNLGVEPKLFANPVGNFRIDFPLAESSSE